MLGLRWILGLAFASSSALVSAAQGNVLIVGPGGFAEIQDAVVAAQDGDTILVRTPTTRLPIDVVGKALTIAADLPGGGLSRAGRLHVRDLPAGKTVVVSRLHFDDPFGGTNELLLQNNAGSVRLVRCDTTNYAFYPPATLKIHSSTGSTALSACSIIGGTPIPSGGADPGGNGLELVDAVAAVYDSTIRGGDGVGGILPPAPGGIGALVDGDALPARLLLSNSSIQGGRGGPLLACDYPYTGGPGGPGLVVDTGATATRHDSTFAGGPGGVGPPCGTDGAPAAPLVVLGTLLIQPTPSIALSSPTIAREGETISLTFTGTPGDRIFLVAGTRTTFLELPVGLLLVQPGPTSLPQRGPLGLIGSSGTLEVPYPLPQLPAGVGAANLWLQAFARHADGKRTIGSFSVVTVLDSAR